MNINYFNVSMGIVGRTEKFVTLNDRTRHIVEFQANKVIEEESYRARIFILGFPAEINMVIDGDVSKVIEAIKEFISLLDFSAIIKSIR